MLYASILLILLLPSIDPNSGPWTLTLKPNTNPAADAKELRLAMKGFGTIESTIMEILTTRTYDQRKIIADTYKEKYQRDLSTDLKTETSGDLYHLFSSLLMDPFDFLASELRDAMKGWGTDEDLITEILCTHSAEENVRIASFYSDRYNQELSTALGGEISGYYNALMQNLIKPPTKHEGSIRDLSRILTPKIKRKFLLLEQGDRSQQRFVDILGRITFQQIRLVTGDFFDLGRQTLRDTIIRQTSGDFRSALLVLVDAAENTPLYYAKRLFKAMIRIGTDDKTLIRIIVSRAEIDMENIKTEFKKTFKRSLESYILTETSGVYRKALLSLIDGMPTA